MIVKGLIVIILVVIGGSAGLLMIFHPGLGNELGDNSLVTFLYETIPEPWKNWIIRSFGGLCLLISFVFAYAIIMM